VAISVLIVDDSKHFRRTAAKLLTARGYRVPEPAADGEAALASVSRVCPDGVLLDVNLPGRDGFVVAASLASVCPSARIVLTSSEIEDVPTAVLKACGAAAFVSKVDLAVADLDGVFGR